MNNHKPKEEHKESCAIVQYLNLFDKGDKIMHNPTCTCQEVSKEAEVSYCSGKMIKCETCPIPYCDGCFQQCPTCKPFLPKKKEEKDKYEFVIHGRGNEKDGIHFSQHTKDKTCELCPTQKPIENCVDKKEEHKECEEKECDLKMVDIVFKNKDVIAFCNDCGAHFTEWIADRNAGCPQCEGKVYFRDLLSDEDHPCSPDTKVCDCVCDCGDKLGNEPAGTYCKKCKKGCFHKKKLEVVGIVSSPPTEKWEEEEFLKKWENGDFSGIDIEGNSITNYFTVRDYIKNLLIKERAESQKDILIKVLADAESTEDMEDCRYIIKQYFLNIDKSNDKI